MLDRYLNGVVQFHKPVAVITIIVMVALGAGLSKIEINTNVRSFLDPDDSILERYDEFQDIYGSDAKFFIIIAPQEADVFDVRLLELIWEMGIEARDIPWFSSVSSIMESPYRPMPLAQAALSDEDALREFRETILSSPVHLTRLVARDGSAAAVRVNVELPEKDKAARMEALEAAQTLVRQASETNPNTTITLAGNIAVTQGLSEAIATNTARVGVASLFLIGLFLLLTTRSVYATTATLLVVGLAMTATLGLVSWLGIELTVVAGFIPAAIATLAVADTIHLLVGYHAELRIGRDKIAALRNSVTFNARAVLITSITSVAGVLMLNFSEAPPYREMGNMIALGIAIAYAMTMLLWPALMAWFPAPRKTPALLDQRLLSNLGRMVLTHRRAFILCVGAACALLILQNHRNTFTERWYEYLSTQYEARVATDAVVSHFGGLHHVYYSLESDGPEGVFDAEYLSEVEAFQEWFANQPEVNHAAGIVDIFRAAGFVRGSRHEGRLDVQAKDVILTTLALGGQNLNRSRGTSVLNADYSSSAMEVIFKPTDSATLLDIDRQAVEWLQVNSSKVSAMSGLGIDLVFAKINLSNVQSMIFGAGIALLMVTVLLIALLGSVRLGLISLIPNVIPIGLAYGAWGLMDGSINMAVSVGMGICFGLVVDDTVHFLCKYRAARMDGRATSFDAAHTAFKQVGTAIMVSSLVLIAGFSGSLIAEIVPTRQTSAILIMTIGFAMLADLFLLSPLLVEFDKKGRQ
jgi:predicted RND superfamily exporter protein